MIFNDEERTLSCNDVTVLIMTFLFFILRNLIVTLCDLKMSNNCATSNIYVHLEGKGLKCYMKEN